MKKLVNKKPVEEITLDELLTNEYLLRKSLFAYKSSGNSGWCFLARLSSQSDVIQKYGFVAMNYTDTHPRFVEKSMKASLELAMKSREVCLFNGVEELCYMLNNK